MSLKLYGVVSLLFFLSVGCAGLKKEQTVSSYSFDAKVLDSEKLKAGGKMYLVPFSAGVGVEASEALDDTALMLIKGIYEELSSTNSSLTVLTSGEGSSSDFILKGHFVKWSDRATRKQRSIAVEGEIIERATGNVLLHFTDVKGLAIKSGDHRTVGYDIGRDIGRFILSAVR